MPSFSLNNYLVVALVSTLLLAVMVSTPFSLNSLFDITSSTHSQSLVHETEAAKLPMDVRHMFKKEHKEGDTAKGDYVRIVQELVDPDSNCEFCLKFEYIPGPSKKAGYVYSNDKPIDLSEAKRVVFFAKGKDGNEKVDFMAAGKTLSNPHLNKVLYKNQEFAKKTKDLTLKNDWKKFEIDLRGKDLSKITHAFGFEVNESADGKPIIFYLKGIYYDSEPPRDPVQTVSDQ